MNKWTPSLFASAIAAVLFALPTTAIAFDKGDCDAHAAHIDHEIGAKDAVAAFHVLHGDNADEGHIIDKLKHDHPNVEHELEEYVKSGCGLAELEAHANDH